MSENDKPGDETQPVRPQGQPEPAAEARPTPEPATPAAAGPAPGPTPGTAPDPAPDPVPAASGAPAPAAGSGGRFRRWRSQQRGDRAFGLAALIASALAGVIVGGIGTAVFHAVTDDHDHRGWLERHGPIGREGFDRRDDDRGPFFGGPRGVPGELPPTTPPDDEESSGSSS